MSRRPRHPDKDIEKFIRELEQQGWVFTKNKYFKGKCPCGEHTQTIHLTPSNPYYLRNKRQHIARLCKGGNQDE